MSHDFVERITLTTNLPHQRYDNLRASFVIVAGDESDVAEVNTANELTGDKTYWMVMNDWDNVPMDNLHAIAETLRQAKFITLYQPGLDDAGGITTKKSINIQHILSYDFTERA